MAGMIWIKFYTGQLEESDEVAAIFEKFGHEGFGRYWHLLALLGKKFSVDQDTITLSGRFLRSYLRIRTRDKLSTFLLSSELQAVFKAVEVNDEYAFDSRILLELKSRDFKETRSKRDDKAYKSKRERKKKNNITPISPAAGLENSFVDELIKLFNRTLGGTGKIKQCMFLSGDEASALIKLKQEKEFFRSFENWEKVFIEAKKSSWLAGKNDKNFVLTLGWLMNDKNVAKVFHGQYQDTEDDPEGAPKTYDDYLRAKEAQDKALGLA